jgi:hypothetical protein
VHCLAGQPESDTQRDELLLSAVVQVALEAAAGFVGRGYQTLPGGAQILDKPNVRSSKPACPATAWTSRRAAGAR